MELPSYVEPGKPISANNTNRTISAVRNSPLYRQRGAFRHSRASAPVADHPFQIRIERRGETYYAVSTAGLWYGRGAGNSVHGVMPVYTLDSYGNFTNPWPPLDSEYYADTFEIHACEWNLGMSIMSQIIYFFIMQPPSEFGNFVSKHPQIYLVRNLNEDSPEIQSVLRNYIGSVMIVARVFTPTETGITSITQVLRSDYYYTPEAASTAPFVFHRKSIAESETFRCFGGLIRVTPVRVRCLDYSDTETETPYPAQSRYEAGAGYYQAVAGTEVTLSDSELGGPEGGVLICLRVYVSGNGAAQCTWVVRNLSPAQLSSINYNSSRNGRISDSSLATDDLVQIVKIIEDVSEDIGSNRFNMINPRLDVVGTWRENIPVAIVRRVGSSMIAECLQINSGVLDVRPALELQRVIYPDPYVPQSSEAARPSERSIDTAEFEAGVPTESLADVAAYANESPDILAAQNYTA